MNRPSRDRRRRPRPERSPSASEQDEDRGDAGADLAIAEAELGDNDLAEVTLRLVDRVRPYASTLLAGLAALAVAVIVSLTVSSQAETTRRQSWDACMAALSTGDPEAYTEVLRRYPGTDAARWAELLVGEAATTEGAELLFVDRKRAEPRLQFAVETLSALLVDRPRGLLAERAAFALAKARESLGQLEEARRGYESIAAEYADDPLARVARERAAELGREATRQWYDWFSAQSIAPPEAAPNAAPPEPAATPRTGE